MRKALIFLLCAAFMLVAGYFAFQLLFSTASKAKESIEMARLKEFGEALQRFKDGNGGEFPVSANELAPFTTRNIEEIWFYQDVETGEKLAWLIFFDCASDAGRFLRVVAPRPFTKDGRQTRIVLLSDGTCFFVSESEYERLLAAVEKRGVKQGSLSMKIGFHQPGGVHTQFCLETRVYTAVYGTINNCRFSKQQIGREEAVPPSVLKIAVTRAVPRVVTALSINFQ